MPRPSEHKTVQARILAYAEAIGWTPVSREEAEQRRGFDPEVPPKDRAKGRSLFFDDLLDAKVREFNPRYAEAEGALLGQFRHFHADIYGNREFVDHLRNRGKFVDHEEKRPRSVTGTHYNRATKMHYSGAIFESRH
jgi:type I restriction enzyme, R subunit